MSNPLLCFGANKLTTVSDGNSFAVYPKIDYGLSTEAKIVKRGEYLTKIGDCIACHTDSTHKGASFAGNLPMKTSFGVFYSPNITPDKETGIGKWDFEDFVHAMREGKRPNGSNLFPVFPYLYYAKVSDDDLAAMWAYLQKIPAVKNEPHKNEVHFPFSWRFLQSGWKLLFFDSKDKQYQYDTAQSPQWNRGAYLVQGLGHCGMCHTPMNFLGAPKNKYFLTGAFVEGFWAPNISRSGLERVKVQDVIKVFQVAELPNKAGTVVGPMAEVNHSSLIHLNDYDLHAIAIYLKSVKSQERLGISGTPEPPSLERGKKVYNSACSTCHDEGQEGAPTFGNANAWNERVKQGARSLYRHAIDGYNLMPLRGGCTTCTDNDITAATDYIIYSSLTPEQWQNFQNPKPIQVVPEVSGKEIYDKYCSVCHNDGKFGAPKLSDKKAWDNILAKSNFDDLVTYTLKGSDKKPPKGGCKYCNTADIIAALKYMVQESKSGDYSLW